MTALYIKIREGKLPNLSAGLHSYLLAMGKFKVIDHLRAKSKLAVQDLPEEIEKIAFEPIEEVNQDRLKQTQNALLTLGAKCQEIIKLFYYEGKSIKDIATTLNYKDENTVKSHKSRCLKTLKQKLDRL
jgi:RNA polymerase sigma-70 factor (ECF subfamily)